MTRPDPLDLLRQRLDRSAKETPECLDDATLAALAEGALDAAARAVVLPHLATCARCRGIVASVVRSLADQDVAREVAAVHGRGRRPLLRIALPAAAAAAILLAIALPRWADDSGRHRGPPSGTGQVPRPVSPVGTVQSATLLRWSSVAQADRYRVVLFNAGGRVLYEIQLADTLASLPDSVRLVVGEPYLWKVEARIGPDRWAASELVRFSIAGAAHR